MPESWRKGRARVIVPLLGVGLALALVAVRGFLTGPLRSVVTFRQVDSYPLYVMHIYGAYGADDFGIGGQGALADSLLVQGTGSKLWACTVFAALNGKDDLVVGRNFDWFNRPSLLLFTHPPKGYASVSMVDISYLGFDTRKPSWSERFRLLEAPLLPFDGMNEAGLAVGMMAVPQAQPSDDPGKATIDSLHVIRLLLDHAGSVEEAISYLGNYNIDWGGGPPLHYLVADKHGNSAVIEFVEGKMSVVRPNEPWQVGTNFQLTGTRPAEAKSLCSRYRRASEVLEQNQGSLSADSAMVLLSDVSQEITMWSVVYEVSSGEIAVAMGRDYDHVHRFLLPKDSE